MFYCLITKYWLKLRVNIIFIFKLFILIFRYISWILHTCTTPSNAILKTHYFEQYKMIFLNAHKIFFARFFYILICPQVYLPPSPNSNTQLLASYTFYLFTCRQALTFLHIVSIGKIIHPRKGATINRHQPLSSIDPLIQRQ